MDNKLDLIWITDMITNKITDRIVDKITDMTSKLQMLITFAMVVHLRPTIYQNAQNSEENRKTINKHVGRHFFNREKNIYTSSIYIIMLHGNRLPILGTMY